MQISTFLNITFAISISKGGTWYPPIGGINAPTRGEVFICRQNIEYELSECQKEIGYCPQYNPLFKKLTVEEHLRLYGKLKSDIWDRVGDERITRLLNEINLMEKRNELAKNLSGGMKRKLCVAMALIGNSRVVLLDEPTTGMDPEARHDVAQMLIAEKKHRTILMTTHNMDEADLLGDQIAIMCKGRLICKGSSEYLKKRFGTGYILTLVINGDAAVHEDSIQLAIDATMDAIKNCVPNAKLESTCGMQFSVNLPTEDTNAFVHLFEELEFRKGELDLSTFGLSLSTMEQVFLRVGEMAEPSDDQDNYEDVAARASALFGHCGYEAKPWTVFLNQTFAILCRYFLNAWRHKQRTLFPFILLALALIIVGHSTSNPVIKQTRSFNLLKQEAFTIPMQLSPNETIANFSDFAGKVPHSKHISFAQNANFSKEILNHGYDYPALGIGVQAVNKTFIMFFNGAAYHGPPLALNFLSNTLLNESVNSINVEIKVYSPVDKGRGTGNTYNTPYILTMVCFSFLTSLYVIPLADDRVSCFKHQLLLTKLKKVTYWLAVTIFYLIFYVLFCLMFSTMLVFFKVIPSSLCWITVLLCLLYFVAATPMSYVASFAFTSPIHATTAMLSVNFIAGPILVVTLKLILSFLNFVRGINVIYLLLYIVLPAFPFVDSISDIYRQCAQIGYVEDWDDIVAYSIYMVLSGAFWWLMLFLLEHSFERQSFRGDYQNLSYLPIESDTEELLDEDVRDEIIRVHETPYHRLALSVRDISKSFGNFRALRDVTFGVNPNDCFGLLGVNGAGKTTTFDIITGRTLATSGNAHVSGVDIRQMPVIGYCPQFDALPTDLTGRQVLTILGRLNAFYNVEERVNIVLESIQMTAQADKLVYHYSGGQKRRISIGVTLMSRASLIMLDEPTAGIDPKTRRHIWNLLCAIRDQRVAILLTSHSMDECEVLCSRIGFLNNGSLISIGSSQHLKSRFGNSFLLTLTVSNPSVNILKYLNVIVTKKFGAKPTTDLYYMNVLHWEIPRRMEDSWSDLYRRAQEIANWHHPTFANDTPMITDFSVTQNSLEHVFLRLSKLGALHRSNTLA
uniref:ABC transporter domain-containing protein n=1 Tax=Panagrellus redivivus TaxID=6233 RepID=A0A7E4WBQ9_PANRE